MDLSVSLGSWKLDNPVIPASGTYGYGLEFSELYDINILGSISVKGTTLEERFGNPLPRIAETPSGMLNSVGLQNPGARAVVDKYFPLLKQVYKKKVFANLGGHDEESYIEGAKILTTATDIVGAIELNISCPNVKAGGMSFGTDPEKAAKITKLVKEVATVPVFVKLSPNVTDITEIAKGVEAGGADGISLINTMLGMRIDLKRRSPVIANKMGGFSGRAIFPVAVRMVYQVYDAVKLPIIGMGGVATADDVIELMLAGATAVQVGAENLVNPYACKDIIENLPLAMQKYGINNLSDIIGGAHK